MEIKRFEKISRSKFFVIDQNPFFLTQVVWRRDVGSGVFYSSPRLSTLGDIYVGSMDGPLYALHAESGEVRWRVDTQGPLVGTPLITSRFSTHV